MSNKMRFACAALTLALLGAAGCSDERPVRSFAQPNWLKKSDLQGTWYYLQTVLDAPPTNTTMFVGQSSELIKGRFDVEENFLYYRRSYEQIGGTEDMREYDPRGYYGQPLAAWKITGHFDLIRDYNPVTGEQTNKIIESSERPWFQREFFRVDWSQNLVTDYVGIGLNLAFSDDKSLQVQPSSFWEPDPTKPDGLYKEFADPKSQEFQPGEMTYLDVTNKTILTPIQQTLTYPDGQTVTYPKCFLFYHIDDCASQVIKVRHAFARVSDKHDYVARDWDGLQMERFGIWDPGLNRLTYNRQYGITNSGFQRHAARFNLWQQSYPRDKNGQLQEVPCTSDPNSGDDSCTAMNPDWVCGNYFDGVLTKQICQVAPAKRKLRTIPYYAESSLREHHVGKAGEYDVDLFGADLFDTGKEVVRQWNEALKASYTLATKDRSKDKVMDPANTGLTPDREVFVFCHSPVKMADDAQGPKDADACWQSLQPLVSYDALGRPVQVLDEKGNKIYRPRQGDPRYSTIFWVNEYQAGGPLGYGPPLFDPVTGETISGQAYIYGASLDNYATRSRDLALLTVGQIKTQDYIKGVNVAAWVRDNHGGAANRGGQTFTHDEVMNRSLAMDFGWAAGLAPEAKIKTSGSVREMMDSIRARSQAVYNSGVFGVGQGNPAYDRKAKLRNTAIESMMITPDDLTGLGRGAPVKWEALTDAEKTRVSPLRSRAVERAIRERLENMAALGVDFADFFDEGIYQRVLAARQGNDLVDPNNNSCDDGRGGKAACFDAEKLRQYLRKEIFLGVTLHEMGHNMGLRHNFRASYDAMNYFPTYWDLREKGKSATRDCLGRPYPDPQPGQLEFEGKLRPRYINRPGGATSDVECNGGVREYQYSSIMDYGAEFNSDLHGLGLYDKAAMKFSYAEYYEGFSDAKADSLTKFTALQDASASYGLPTPIEPDPNGLAFRAVPYTSYPDFFNSGRDGIYKRIDIPREHARDISINQNKVFAFKDGSKTYPVVPYYFCSDEFVGNLTCMRFDAGADSYEQAQDLISRYNNFYLVNNFKRNRYPFSASASYLSRIGGRYFEPLRQQLTWYSLLRGEFQDLFLDIAKISGGDPDQVLKAANDFFVREDQWGSFTAGVTMGFDALGDVLTRPGYGSYVKVDADSNHPTPYWKLFRDQSYSDAGIRNIPVGAGRYPETTWDFTGCGYYWYEQCMTRVGYFIDKMLAMETLTESQAYFTGRDTSTDVRKYAIGYYRIFPQQMQDRLAALLAGDLDAYAPRFGDVMQGSSNNYSIATGSWTLGTVPKGGDVVDPSTGFTLQLQAGVNALAGISSGFDRNLIQNSQIFIVGNGEASVADSLLLNGMGKPGALATDDPFQLKSSPDCDPRQQGGETSVAANKRYRACIAGKKEWFIYTSPGNGRTYAAHSVGRSAIAGATGTAADTVLATDIGVRMLVQLQKVDTRLQDARASGDPRQIGEAQLAYDKFIANIEIMRSLHNAYGYARYQSDAPFYY